MQTLRPREWSSTPTKHQCLNDGDATVPSGTGIYGTETHRFGQVASENNSG